jgi:hypothetical protein
VKQHKAATTMPMTPVATSRLSDMHERIVERRLTGLSILRHPSVIGSLCRALERNRLGSIGGALDFAALIMAPARFALSGFTYRRRAALSGRFIPLRQSVEIVCLEELSIAFDRVAIAGCIAYVLPRSDRALFPIRSCSHAV